MPYFTMTSTSSLQLHSHTDQNTMFQTNKHTKKGNPKGSGLKKKKKILFIFCKSENWETLFIHYNNRRFRSNLENYSEGMDFIPLFVFYSITVYRVLKRLPFSLISNLFLQSLEFCLFDFCSLFGCFLLCLCFSYVSWI